MARTRFTYLHKGSSEWVEQGEPSDPQNNSREEDTCQEQHSGAHHVDLSGKPDHISVNSEEEESSSGGEDSNLLSSSSEDDEEEEEVDEEEEDDEEEDDNEDDDEEDIDDDDDEDYMQEEEVIQQVQVKGTYSGKPISSNDTEPGSKISRARSESRMGEPKISEIIIEHLNKTSWTTPSKLSMGEPNSTKEVQVGRYTNYRMGEPDVYVLEEADRRTGKPSSYENKKSEETTKRSSGEPSSRKEKNSFGDQLITGKPFLTEKNQEKRKEKKKKRSLGKPNTLNKTKISEDQLQTGEPNSTEEVQAKITMGKPSSSEKWKFEETIERSSGEPNFNKHKKDQDDRLIVGEPFSIEKIHDKTNKRSLGEPNTLNKTNISEKQLQTGEPNSTEEMKDGKNTKYTMGEPGVNVFKKGKSKLGKPRSGKEMKDTETTMRCSGEPSSHNHEKTSYDELNTGEPSSTPNMKVKSIKNKTTGKPNYSLNVNDRTTQNTKMGEPNKLVDMEITKGANSKTGEPKIQLASNTLAKEEKNKFGTGVPNLTYYVGENNSEQSNVDNPKKRDENEIEEGEILEPNCEEEEYLFQENLAREFINQELEEIDDKQSMTSTINKFTDNFGIVNEQSPQKETNKKSTTSTSKFQIAQQAANRHSKKSPRESVLGNVHFVSKTNHTPKSSKKIPYDPKKHNISSEKGHSNEFQPSVRNFNETNIAKKNPQILLRWDNPDSTKQYPRENVNLGIDRSLTVPRIFTKAARSDYRSYYRKFFKQNLSETKYNKRGKYLVRSITRFIHWCVQQQKKVTNKDIDDKLHSLGLGNEFFDENEVYYNLLDMIFNSVHSSLSGIPLQRTVVPGRNHNSWYIDLREDDKMNINEVYLDDLKDDEMEETSEASTKDKKKKERFIGI